MNGLTNVSDCARHEHSGLCHREGTPEHVRAREAIIEALNHRDGWGIPYPVIAEFWSIVTFLAAPRPILRSHISFTTCLRKVMVISGHPVQVSASV